MTRPIRHALRGVVAGLAVAGLLVAWAVDPAWADNCGTPTDCFGTAGSFTRTAWGLIVLSGLSLVLDLLPGVGLVQGGIEAATGRDLLTGQELAPWERALGAVPFVGALGAVVGLARAADNVAEAARAADTLGDAGGTARSAADRAASVVEATSDASPTVPRIGGKSPRNSGYAGRAYDGRAWTPELSQRYPEGVRFTGEGFPDFSPYARARVQIDDLTGVYARDAAAANRAVGLPRTPEGYTWHHVEDGRTMILIPRDLHGGVPHTGGAAVIRNGGFDPLSGG